MKLSLTFDQQWLILIFVSFKELNNLYLTIHFYLEMFDGCVLDFKHLFGQTETPELSDY